MTEESCAIYLRVSTEDQNPENQIADVKRFAEALKYKVIEIYIDKESGQYSDRREFQRMMADARAKKFKILFIWALDRFSREGIEATLFHIKQLTEAGVALKSYQEQWLDTSVGGISELLIAILSWAAREELKRFKERSMAGKRTMLANGKLIGSYPPYGYRHVKRDKEKGTDAYFEIDEVEAAMVRKIYSLYIKEESLLAVAHILRREGVKARGKGRAEPGYFQTSTIAKILIRETYIGNHYYGKSSPCIAKFHIRSIRKHHRTGRRVNPKSDWNLIKIPPIISEEIFYKVQEIRKRRAKHRLEMSKYQFLCQGIVRCVRCGRSYGGRCLKKENYLFYRCPQAFTSNINAPPCKSRSMGQKKLDNIVWNFISSFISDEKRVKKALADLKNRRINEKSKSKDLLKNLSAEKGAIKNKRRKLLDLYGDSEISDYAKKDLKSQLSDFDKKEQLIDQQIVQLEKDMEEIRNLDWIEKEIGETCRRYQDKLKNPSFELKKFIVNKWVEAIYIQDDGSVKIRLRIPHGEQLNEEDKNLNYKERRFASEGLRIEEWVRV